MLNAPAEVPAPKPWYLTTLFLAAILLGSFVGGVWPRAGESLSGAVNPLVLVLITIIFFSLRLEDLASLRRAPRLVLLAVGVNFLIIPAFAFGLSALLIPDHALRVGVLIYCLAPCTDWFLGFTRLAGGDTTVGAALIPTQLILQLALFPLWLKVFTGDHIETTLSTVGPALWTWFVIPALIALTLRTFLHFTALRPPRQSVTRWTDTLVPIVIAALIACLFVDNVGTIIDQPAAFGRVLFVVFAFFVIVFFLGEAISRLAQLSYPERALLTMTTSARNAPLMLALTAIALPGQSIVAAAIILGMLIEFPHLTAITHLLRRRFAPTSSTLTVEKSPWPSQRDFPDFAANARPSRSQSHI